MSKTINFGIDLGTTNSAIAKFVNGDVEIFNNPLDYGRNTLPSVVAFRKDKVIIGSKAKERMEKDSKNVVSIFKRKMGTSESYPIKAIKQSKTPIDLSALILKQLKTFVQSGEQIDATVITIPASFDTIQSNATKEAGQLAGFKQVVLLQEPIAASLAYANKKKDIDLKNGKWLVYDLGGGTFDVALISVLDGEMKVLDHEGDNFLGGSDFDQLIVEKFIIPHLEKEGQFQNLNKEMKSATGKYNALYYSSMHKAEKAKIELSAGTSAEIELILEDDEGEEIDTVLTITRSEFEDLIKESIDSTGNMIKKIITKNSLIPQDLQFILMVGGSTYIPYVRKRVEEITAVKVNTGIDPTTAIAIGAAFYAGTKVSEVETVEPLQQSRIKVKLAYQKATKELEEFFAAKFTGDIEGLSYRIDREDGGFSTGLKPVKKQIHEELPLVPKAFNYFNLKVYDDKNNIVQVDIPPIGINSGYAISGQPLPHDISLEVDDLDHSGKTKLELIFLKNTILPSKKTITRTLNKTIVKGADESIRVNILEGPHSALPEANLSIGFLEIQGSQLSRDISKGSDIEITLEISESRDLTVSAYLIMLDQEFKQVFTPKERNTPVSYLIKQVDELYQSVNQEIIEAEKREDYQNAKDLSNLKRQLEEVKESSEEMVGDDVTDRRYQLEDKKRKLAQEIDSVTKDKRLQVAILEYEEEKEKCAQIVQENGNDYEHKILGDLLRQEESFLKMRSPLKIKEKTEELSRLKHQILWRVPEFLVAIFNSLSTDSISRFNNLDHAKSFITSGKVAIANQDWDKLKEVNHSLFNLLPDSTSGSIITRIGF